MPAIFRALDGVIACIGQIQAINLKNALLNKTSNKF
jgi:hypothetical protein